jgi:hypothetical protein
METANLDALYTWFARFVAGFSGDSPADQRNYDLKVEHTYKVCGIMRRLASAAGLSAAGCRLAEAVALCHDVGRFPQYQRYRTFNDAVSVNHGVLAVQTLKEQQVLAWMPASQREIVLQAVALHNIFRLPSGLSSELCQLAQLIRDADKLDIWRVLIEYCTNSADDRASAVVWGLPFTGECSGAVIAEIMAGRMVDRVHLRSADDFILLQLSWVFDLNYQESFAILAEAAYIDTLASLLPGQPACQRAVAVVRSYVENRRNVSG